MATHGLSVVEAESGSITGGTVVTPESSWTGEANWSGGAYVDLAAGGTLRITVPADDQARRVHPIVNQVVDPSGTTTWTSGTGKPGKGKPGSGTVTLGTTANGGAGEQGVTEAPGQLLPLPLTNTLPGKTTQVIGTTDAAAQLDALLIQPLISTVAVTGPAGDSTLFVSADTADAQRRIDVPRGQQLVQQAFDATGQPVADWHKGKGDARSGKVFIAAGGFTQVWFEAKK
ncbi:hypothetical protein [Cryobacterium sp. PAMC25264]|uniref:hypothetical protein n=1 Tax=Cryobacterium sp. PAMC25264 TaxID=2861288 RepID=UPI001C62F737|nr:hypothetical protein [Cryobacterium sp. PAMC25264]QYF72323.1 hypothetical protein KY500_10715 [Cryobacterium sp. PAMC25264]